MLAFEFCIFFILNALELVCLRLFLLFKFSELVILYLLQTLIFYLLFDLEEVISGFLLLSEFFGFGVLFNLELIGTLLSLCNVLLLFVSFCLLCFHDL